MMPIEEPLPTSATVARLSTAARLRGLLHDTSPGAAARRDAVFVVFVRAASAAVLYLSQIVLARWLGAGEYGIYIWVWTLVTLLGGLSHLGVGRALARLIPAYRDAGNLDALRGLVIGARWLALVGGSVIALAAYLVVRFAGDRFLAEPFLVPAMLGIVCIPLFAMTDVQDGLGRAQGWLSVALVPPYVMRPVILLVTMALANAAGLPMDAATAVLAAIVASWASAMVQTLMVQQRLDSEVPKGPRSYQFGTWIGASLPLLVLHACELVVQNADLLILSAYVPPETLAMYFAAAKTMALVIFVHDAVGSAVAEECAALHARGDRAALAAYARSAVQWTFWPSLATTIAILLLGKPLLWLFSPAFTEAYPVMLVLSAGLLFRASVGPAEFLLNALGEQKWCALVAGVTLVADIALNLLLVPAFAMHGAAAATAIALAIGALLNGIVVRRRTGLDIALWSRLLRRT